jgi:peptidoglycan/LPS O-acetylase OafA/YrhL
VSRSDSERGSVADRCSDEPSQGNPPPLETQPREVNMSSEVKALTGLRGVAAAIVMFYHFCEFDPHYLISEPNLIARGYLGVDVFFVLSGFVMALSYSKNFSGGFTLDAYKGFMARRIARIYPLYLVITIFFAAKLLYNYSGAPRGDYVWSDFLAAILMVQAWGFGFASAAGATWSLSTEFFAYLVFPVLIVFTLFTRAVYAVIVFALCFVSLLLIVSSHQGISGALDVVASDSFLPLLRCLIGFSLGLICYRLIQSRPCRQVCSSPFVLLAILVGILLAAHAKASDLILFAFFPFVVMALYCNSSVSNLLFSNKLIYHFGIISYSLYLIHPFFVPVKTRLEPIAESYLGSWAYPMLFCLITGLTWISAYLLYRFVEMPGRRLVQQLFSGQVVWSVSFLKTR